MPPTGAIQYFFESSVCVNLAAGRAKLPLSRGLLDGSRLGGSLSLPMILGRYQFMGDLIDELDAEAVSKALERGFASL